MSEPTIFGFLLSDLNFYYRTSFFAIFWNRHKIPNTKFHFICPTTKFYLRIKIYEPWIFYILGVLRFIFITSWLDWAVIAMMAIILIFNTAALWTILTILLIMFMCREVFQMTVSLKRYIFTPENWIEGLMIVFGE